MSPTPVGTCSWAGLTCSVSTTRATQIMMTTSSWDGQILGAVPVAHGGEGDDAEVKGRQEGQLSPWRPRCWMPQVLEPGRGGRWGLATPARRVRLCLLQLLVICHPHALSPSVPARALPNLSPWRLAHPALPSYLTFLSGPAAPLRPLETGQVSVTHCVWAQ